MKYVEIVRDEGEAEKKKEGMLGLKSGTCDFSDSDLPRQESMLIIKFWAL